MMTFLSLRINIIMRGFYVISTLSSYSLLSAMLIHDLDVIDDAENKLIF
jgi:hypothetical protein